MSKAAANKVAVLKGQEAEDRVLAYIKRMNRPYGAVDIAANLKGAVPKTAAQKILTALAEKGELAQKTYGKTVFFAPNQEKAVSLAPDELAALEKRCSDIEDSNKIVIAEVKAAQLELARIRSTPSSAELTNLLETMQKQEKDLTEALTPLRSGAPVLSAEEVVKLDKDWVKWRGEWVRRRKVFTSIMGIVKDAAAGKGMSFEEVREDLGIEEDEDDHLELERGELCTTKGVRR